MKKNFRFLLLSALCLVAMTLSSCLNSDNSDNNGGGLVKAEYLNGALEFVDAAGNTFIPTTETIGSSTINPKSGELDYIIYTANNSTSSPSTKTYSVTLTYFASLESNSNQLMFRTWNATNDSINSYKFGNDSIISVGSGAYNDKGVYMFGTYLLACLNFYPVNSPLNNNNIFYYSDKGLTLGNGTNPDTLKVWLCHHSVGTLLQYTSYQLVGQAPTIYYYGYDLTQVLQNSFYQTTKKDSIIVDLKAKIASPYTSAKPTWSDNCCTYKFGN